MAFSSGFRLESRRYIFLCRPKRILKWLKWKEGLVRWRDGELIDPSFFTSSFSIRRILFHQAALLKGWVINPENIPYFLFLLATVLTSTSTMRNKWLAILQKPAALFRNVSWIKWQRLIPADKFNLINGRMTFVFRTNMNTNPNSSCGCILLVCALDDARHIYFIGRINRKVLYLSRYVFTKSNYVMAKCTRLSRQSHRKSTC